MHTREHGPAGASEFTHWTLPFTANPSGYTLIGTLAKCPKLVRPGPPCQGLGTDKFGALAMVKNRKGHSAGARRGQGPEDQQKRQGQNRHLAYTGARGSRA